MDVSEFVFQYFSLFDSQIRIRQKYEISDLYPNLQKNEV
jgi:hypothetical protein